MSVAAQLRQPVDRCSACGARRQDSEERQLAEIALAHILALQKRPGALAMFEEVLRQLTGIKSSVARIVAREEEDAALRR